MEPLLAARKKYRDALSLKHGDGGPWGRAEYGPFDRMGGVNFSYRYMRWLTAQGMGERPVISSNRDATPDEKVAPMVDVLLGRVLEEGNAFAEWRQTYADKCWLGSSVVWYGYHALLTDVQQVMDASESPAAATERALQGDPAARPGQDREMMAAALRAPGEDRITALETGSDGIDALTTAAQSHDALAEMEEGRARDVRVEDRQIWFKRGVWGEDCAFDPVACDPSDWEWVMQTVTMRVEEARELAVLRPAARKRLNGSELKKGAERNAPNATTSTSGVPDVDDETKRVTLYLFWDKRHERRHIISPELPNEYLEVDEANPYVDESGKGLIPGFFPMAHSAPDLPPTDGAERVLGQPLVATGWQAERDADSFAAMMVSDANKHARRDYVLNPNLKNKGAVRKALRGPSGAMIDGHGLDPAHLDKAIIPVQYRGSSGEIESNFAAAESRWVKAMAMPHAELSSQAQSSTATQEEIGVAAGRNEAEDIIKQDERAFACMVEGVRGLVRGLYNQEKILALLGPKYMEDFELWSQSALDGDSIEVKFGSRVFKEEAVRISQIQKAIDLATGYTGPMGLPIFNLQPLYEELFQKLDMGKPQEVAPEVMQARQLIDHLVQENQRLQQEAAEAHKEGKREAQQKQAGAGKPGPGKGASGTSATPKRDTINSGTRRGTSTAK